MLPAYDTIALSATRTVAKSLNQLYPLVMRERLHRPDNVVLLGVGLYTVPDAARLLKIPSFSIRRWLGGYSYKHKSETHHSPPLWVPDLPNFENKIELTFRDLIELRFVHGFVKEGLPLRTIRLCLNYARTLVDDPRPFSTRRFQTDGKTIFLDSVRDSGDIELLDLRKKQYAIKHVIERTFKDLDIEANAVARWRPYKGKNTIVIDPTRAFGKPIANASGVPTVVLADAVEAEGSIDRVARLYEVTPAVVRDALGFEEALRAA
jgi:uncharacterized protein (DUF433 family)